MKYPVKYPFRDRDGIEHARGDIMDIDDMARAGRLQERGLIGKAIKETMPEKQKTETPDNTVEYPIPLPGGYYILPNGSKVRGKKTAEEAMKGGEIDESA